MQLDRRTGLSLAAALLAGGGASWWLQRAGPPGRKLDDSPVLRAVLDDRGSPRAGAAQPETTIVLFTDYRCPICRATDGAVEALLRADPSVQVVFKDWPVLGAASEAAARLALAAEMQGRYLPMHRALMTLKGDMGDASLRAAADAAGVDRVRLLRDLDNDAARIDRQLAGHGFQAWSLGLAGTPAYLVGPYLIQGGLDDAALRRAVRRARRT